MSKESQIPWQSANIILPKSISHFRRKQSNKLEVWNIQSGEKDRNSIHYKL